MGSHEDVLASEAVVLELLDGALNVVVNKDWFGCVEEELGDGYVWFVALRDGLRLNFSEKLLISLGIT